VLLAVTDTRWDARDGSLRLAPRDAALDGDAFRSFVSTADGWGEVEASPAGASIRVLGGTLGVAEAVVEHPAFGRWTLAEPVGAASGDRIDLVRDTQE
jgi:hypothetical protein